MTWGQKTETKQKKHKQYCNKFNKDLKNSLHQKKKKLKKKKKTEKFLTFLSPWSWENFSWIPPPDSQSSQSAGGLYSDFLSNSVWLLPPPGSFPGLALPWSYA